MTLQEMYQWQAYLRLPYNFALPNAPTSKNDFLRLAMQSKQVPLWRSTLQSRMGLSAADAAAFGTRIAAFNHLVANAPF